MAIRTINGPGKRSTQEYVSAAEAGEFLGVGARTFKRLAEGYPWCKVKLVSGSKKYHWLDVIAISRMIDTAGPQPDDQGAAKPGKTRKDVE